MSDQELDLGDRTALVTGGSRGIGRATAELLAARGAKVAVNYFRGREDAEEVVAGIVEAGGEAVAVRGNAGKPEHQERLVAETTEALGAPSVLVANAASGPMGKTSEIDFESHAKCLAWNGAGFANLARLCVEAGGMDDDGRIVAVTALGSRRHIPSYGAMGPAKAAMEGMVRMLAVEYAPRGITVNAVSPGITDTKMLSYFKEREQILAGGVARTPAGRLGTAEDAARSIVLFCLPLSGWITGQTIDADGGFTVSC